MWAMILGLLLAPAHGGDAVAVQTAEGPELTATKRWRAWYMLQLVGEPRSEQVRCTDVHAVERSQLALWLQTAGQRAQGGRRLGGLVSYPAALRRLRQAKDGALLGVCAMGIHVLDGAVVVTLGTVYKANGRTATLTPADAIALGQWLGER